MKESVSIDPEKVKIEEVRTESECRKELAKMLTDLFCLTTAYNKQYELLNEADQYISDLKLLIHDLRAKNKKLQQQVDSYATCSDDSRARISVIQYRQMLGEERNEKYYYIKKLRKEIGKTTELVQAINKLKQRNKSLLGNFKALNNVNHDDLELAIGLYTELVKQVSFIMDKNKPDTTLDYKKTLDEVIQTINQQGSMINEIYTVIQNSKNRKD